MIDTRTRRSVRVSLKPEFFEDALNSPLVQPRAKGVEPQDIPAEIVDPLVEKVLDLPDEQFLEIGEIQATEAPRKGIFKTRRCHRCGEVTFVNRLRVTEEGDFVCIPCSGWGS